MNPEQELWAVLDLRGLILQSYYSGVDPDAARTAEGVSLNTPGHAITNLTERYLLPILNLVPLNRVIAVNDAGNEYRKAILPTYKASRTEPEPEVRQSQEMSTKAVRELLYSLGIAQVSVAGTEADDVIAYLVGRLPGRKLVYTVDGDMVALADDMTTVFLKGEPAAAFTKGSLEVDPKHLTLFKSLVGDTSDNYKGVPGFGPAAWVKLLEEYGDDGIAELMEIAETQDFTRIQQTLDAEPGQHKLLERIQKGLSEWRTSYEVAKLHPELVDQRWGHEFRRLRWDKRVPSRERLERLTESTGSSYLLEDLQAYLPQQFLIQAGDWDDSVLGEAKALFEQSRFIALDWETWAPENENFDKASTGEYVDMFGSKISGMGITCGANLEFTFYFQFDHADAENNIPKECLVEMLKLIPEGMPIVAQNMYFELSVLSHELDYLLPNCHDTKIMASHVDESDSNGLKDLSKRWLNYNQIRYRDIIERGKTMRDYPGHHVFKYGADDPLVTGHLYDLFQTIMYIEGTWEFVRDNELPTVYQLVDAYLAGVSLDWDEVERQHAEDAETFRGNIASIRTLLRENQTSESIEAGAQMWVQELQQNHDGDTRLMMKFLRTLDRDPSPALRIKENNPALWKLLSEAIAEDSEYEEIVSQFEDIRMRERIGLIKVAREAATYEDYSEALNEPKFSWCPIAINTLAASYGLPGDLQNKDGLAEFLDKLEVLAIRPELEQFCTDLRTVEAADKNRTKTEAYGRLRDRYKNVAEGKVVKSGSELNLNSPKQMQELLYAMLQLPVRLRGFEVSESRELRGLPAAPQTDKDVIAAAMAYGDAPEGSWQREVLELLSEAKKADTRIKFFYTKFPLWRHPLDGLIHPQFSSVGTETRRPSGSAPNLLQLSKGGEGLKVRRCFIPNEKLGHDLIIAIDFDGQELRIMGGLSGDKALTACYLGDDKKNVHSMTACGIAGVPYEDFIKGLKSDTDLAQTYGDIRKASKIVNFLSAYGGGAGKLSRKLLCTVETAKEYLEAKKRVYFGLEEWRAREIEKLHKQGFVKTVFGSIKHVFSRLNSSDDGLVSYYERASVNFEVQGLAADYLKLILANMWRKQTLQKHGAVLIAGIYDELVFSAHHSVAVDLIKDVYAEMTIGIPGFEIPMLANPSLGVNFADQIEILSDCDDPLTDEKILIAIDKAFGRYEEPEEQAA